jgi:hypothetical protein
MRADGYQPIPVFTRGAPWSDLQRLLDEGERYICLGNIAKEKRPERLRWCREVFACTLEWMARAGEPLPRYHAFGVGEQEVLQAFPFYSCDSSSALMVSAYGNVQEFKDGQLRLVDLQKERNVWKHPHLRDEVVGDRVFLARRARCVRAANEMAAHVTKVWAARGVTWEDEAHAA